MTRVLAAFSGALTAALFALPLNAQSCTAQGTGQNLASSCTLTPSNISITIQRTVRVTVSPSSAILLPPNQTDFTNGYQQGLGQVVEARSNGPWQVHISSAQANFTAAGGARPNKARAELLWSTDLTGTFTPMTGTPTLLASGPATGSTVTPVYYRVLWSWPVDLPGSYSLPITITISSP